jgi:hypothetical protein
VVGRRKAVRRAPSTAPISGTPAVSRPEVATLGAGTKAIPKKVG